MDLIFGILFQIFTGLLIFAFVKDYFRKECQENDRYYRLSKWTQVVIFFASFSDLTLLIVIITIIVKMLRASKRRRLNPQVLSSDEEDDAEFLRVVESTNERNA